MSMVFCRGCGKEIHESALTCPHCGAPQKVASASTDIIPDGIRGWSWGAFWLNWIWAIGNRVWWGLLAIIPYVGIIVAIYLGFKGRELAWQSGKWESVEHFQRVQKKWSQWGNGLIIFLLVMGILAAIAIPAYADYKNRKAEVALLNQTPVETQQPIETTSPEQNGYTEADEADEIVSNEAEEIVSNDNVIQLEANEKQVDSSNDAAKLSPSFDCLKATTNAEVMICNSTDLAEADIKLANTYSLKYESSVDKDILQAEQNAWRVTQRDSCWDEACILQAYKQRIHELTL